MATDLVTSVPLIGTIGEHGGGAPTIKPLAGSPARNRGTCTLTGGATLSVDQRGAPRPQGGACDIGALEGGVLITTNRLEPAGTHCASGGLAFDRGEDVDDNQLLSDDEISATQYVCNGTNGMNGTDGMNGMNGTNGVDGVNALIRITPEPAGSNCAAGGQRVDAGGDDDQDGTLGVSEIDSTAYVCNGADGTDGTDSTNGTNGTNGMNGADGANGQDGMDGAPGRDGIDGQDGAPGRDGIDGKDAGCTVGGSFALPLLAAFLATRRRRRS